ncbi:hypothetical protein [Halobacteriovorax sp. RZ-2]|uniref:hypothetical protein n=1 Tax=unclassified Halobacteriovorax TaxID=2639665 RepID=UPI00371FB4C8
MNKAQRPTNVLMSGIGGVFGFVCAKYLGLTPMIPFLLMILSFVLIVFIHNRLEPNEAERSDKNQITKWRLICASILTGHSLWAAIAFIILFFQGMKPSFEFFVSVVMIAVYMSLCVCLVKFRRPRITTAMTILAALVFMALNLTSLNELRYQAFAPLIYLHSFVRVVLIISGIRLMWLLDVDERMNQHQKSSDDKFNVA